MTPKATLKIIHASLEVFVSEMMKHAREGWELDPQNPPMQFGVLWDGTLLKDENLVEPPKPSRAEILANARAAKKAKTATEPVAEAPAEQEPQASDEPAQEEAPAEEDPSGVLSDEVPSEA